jgi:hypothetical protein
MNHPKNGYAQGRKLRVESTELPKKCIDTLQCIRKSLVHMKARAKAQLGLKSIKQAIGLASKKRTLN